VPAIKGDMYINTHCNYSQPTLIKLDNENIGGHLTPLQPPRRRPAMHPGLLSLSHPTVGRPNDYQAKDIRARKP